MIWSASERRAWRPPQKITPSQWAERERVLSRRQSAHPGPWKNAAAQYLVGLMDIVCEPGIEEITIVKAGQIGASEAVRNVIGWLAENDPDPVLLVLPDELVGRKIMRKRIKPLFHDTPGLRELLTERSHDVQLHSVILSNGFALGLGWSGSPSTLAADPVRVVVNDELDKFQEWSGREADPVSLSRVRTATYEHRRRIINISTPTTRAGLVAKLYEQSPIKLAYYVPCSKCGAWQRLTFDRLKWEKFSGIQEASDRAAAIEERGAAWYECVSCGERIDERDRGVMVRAGRWACISMADVERRLPELAPASQPGGIVRVGWPAGKRVGLQISSLYCPWISMAEIAAEFVRSEGDLASQMNFRNSWLGEVFEQQITRSPEAIFSKKCSGAPPAHIVPNWCAVLLATVDVQQDRFYYVVRAWGPGMRSQRVAHGMCKDFDDVRRICLDTRYPPGVPVRYLGIDSGAFTEEVYRFALSALGRVKVMKGEAEPRSVPIRIKRVTYRPPEGRKDRRPIDVWLHLLDTTYFKDVLSSRILAYSPGSDPDQSMAMPAQPLNLWLLNDENDDDYNRQMASEHKVLIRRGRATPVERWILVSSGAANHYWDCEVMQMALANIARVDLLPTQRRAATSDAGNGLREDMRKTGGWKIGR